jgi:hypothetical protein
MRGIAAKQRGGAAPTGVAMMGDEIVMFSVFTLACSAFLAALMLQYVRKVHRLRNIVAALSAVNDLVPQKLAAPRKTR